MLISVIIPARNAATYLDACLRRLGASSFQDYECIVVDDASLDETAAVAARLGATVLRNRHRQGPAESRNRGALAARGSILFFLDADTLAHPDALDLIAARFAGEPELDGLFGSYDYTPAAPGIVSRFRNLLHCFTHQNGRKISTTFWSGCGAIRREVFDSAGGFSASYREPAIEDIELGYRLAQINRHIELDRRLQVTHLKAWNLYTMLVTDIRGRGIPWVLLALRTGRMPNDLATRSSQKISVFFTLFTLVSCIAWLALACLKGEPTDLAEAGWLTGAGMTGFFAVNLPFFLFLRRVQGWRVALAGPPLQALYNCCGIASILFGCAIFCWTKVRGARPDEAEEEQQTADLLLTKVAGSSEDGVGAVNGSYRQLPHRTQRDEIER